MKIEEINSKLINCSIFFDRDSKVQNLIVMSCCCRGKIDGDKCVKSGWTIQKSTRIRSTASIWPFWKRYTRNKISDGFGSYASSIRIISKSNDVDFILPILISSLEIRKCDECICEYKFEMFVFRCSFIFLLLVKKKNKERIDFDLSVNHNRFSFWFI